MKQWVVGIMACTIGVGRPVHVHAQQPQSPMTVARAEHDEDPTSDEARRLLARPVTIDLVDVPRQRAIDLVAANAGVHVSYRAELIRAVRAEVTLHANKTPLSAVFEQMLAGTPLRLTVLPGNELAVVSQRPGMDEAQHAGTIVGRLRDANGTPIANARIALRGTRQVMESKANGTFRFTNVAPGTYAIVATRLGFSPCTQMVKVDGSDSVTVTLVMTTASTRLTEVVTTATGGQERLKVGNDVGTINADSLVQNTLVRDMSDLLTAHTPGVQVTATGGAVGAPSRIRIRGVTSPQLNDDPIVVIDGVRVNTQTTLNTINYFGSALPQSQVNTGKTTMLGSGQLEPSPLDQIDPNMIESIDVLRGPTATALYGPDASTGVIVVKTKVGRPGPWRYHVNGDYGWIVPPRTYPLYYTAWGHSAVNAGSQPGCVLVSFYATSASQANGGCTLDSVTAFNPLNDPQMTTLGTGYNRSLAMDASGGGTTVQGFIQGDYSDILGQSKLSDVEQRRLERLWTTPVPSWMIRPNGQTNTHATSKVEAQFTPNFDVAVTGQATYQLTRNDGSGLNSGSYSFNPGDTLTYLPAENLRARSTSSSKRGIGAANLRYQAFQWLVLTGTGGMDYSLRDDQFLQRNQDCTTALNPSGCTGSHQAAHTEVLVPSFTTGATFTYNPASWLSAHTAFGEQYSRTQTYMMGVSANGLAFGQNLITGATSIGTPTEVTDEGASAGWYAEQQVGFNDRLFLTAAVRRDASSSFGNSISEPVFPKYGLSWVLSNEPFFPHQDMLTQLRVRASYGESGKQGSQTDVLRNFLYTTGLNDGQSIPVLVFSGLGNPKLEPQRDREWEGGFDLSFYNDRATVGATWYRKQSTNSIMSVSVPPSSGVTIPIQVSNIGAIRNAGYEIQVGIRPIDSQRLTWDFNLQASRNTNILLDKGNLINLPSNSGGTIKPGYPLFGYWERPIVSYADVNGNGILDPNEVVFADSSVFIGSSDPNGTIAYSNSVSLLNGRLRFNSLFNQVLGLTTRLQPTVNNSMSSLVRAYVDPHTSLGEQAAVLEAAQGGAYGYVYNVSYVSLAELSASYTLPVAFARRFGSQAATVTVAGRNLALWTSYRGADPMVSNPLYSSGGEMAVDDGTGLAQPKNWVLRFNFQF